MKIHSKALRGAVLFAALLPLVLGASAAGDDRPQEATPTPQTPLHVIGAAPDAPPAAPAAPAAPARPYRSPRHNGDDDSNRVTINDRTYVGPNEKIEGNAVAVLGSLIVDGTVEGNAVAVLGRNTVNGAVRGNAVAVGGNLILGPDARVDGNAVSVGGKVIKDPSAFVGGNVVPVNFGADLADNPGASSFWNNGLRMGRPLAIGPHLHVFWIINLCLVGFYVLIAVVFPAGVGKCADVLVTRPGATLLTGFLAVLGLPVLFLLLCFTVIGIPVAVIILPLAVVGCVMFGKSAVYGVIGRSIAGKRAHAALAVFIGVLVVLALYMIPALGLTLWFVIAFLGFACSLTALFTAGRAAPPAPVAPGPSAAAALSTDVALPVAEVLGAPPLSAAVPPLAATPAPPPLADALPEAALAKAGFWIRMAALLIDAILLGIVTQGHSIFLPALALYGAVLWKLRGATVGGIIFGLKVVRVDGKPSGWETVLVRALACFFSLIVAGLGFIWIAFDPQKQAWHDKIAGTVVVRLPKGVSLV